MKPIAKKDINDMNEIIMELPAFASSSSKEGLHHILNSTLSDIYIDTPKELMEYMRYNLNERLTETILANYGIDKDYSKKVNIAIKRILVFYIERLFQTKGSRQILGTFADIFGNFFENINFYNIVVDKAWASLTFDQEGNPTYEDGDFIMNYALSPIHISDKENILSEIDDDIQLSNKYLMKLEQYKDYSLFPINTNLVYIQFSGGVGAINNMNVFADGIRAYGATYLQQVQIDYPVVLSGKKKYMPISGHHIEMLIQYFQLSHLKHIGEPYEFQELRDKFYTSLIYDLEVLPELEDVLHEYQEADYTNRNEIGNLKRRWQSLLRNNIRTDVDFANYDELDLIMRQLYLPLVEEFEIALADPQGAVIDFYMKLYTETLKYFDLDNTNIQLYVNTIFMQVITGDVFIDTFFKPVFDIFIKYFFPVEMEYLNDFIDRMQIKDKWNTIATDEAIELIIEASEFSLCTPQRGLDRVLLRFDMRNIPVQLDINDQINYMFVKTIQSEERIQLRTSDIALTFLQFNISQNSPQDLFNISLENLELNTNYTTDSVLIETEIPASSIRLNFNDTREIILNAFKQEVVVSVSKQMVNANITKESSFDTVDQIAVDVMYGDYNSPDQIGDFNKNESGLAIKLGLVDYGYWCSQVEQKYTYNKHLYYKTIIG